MLEEAQEEARRSPVAEPFDTLMAVQEHDTTIDQLHRRRETLDSRQALDAVRAGRARLVEELAGARSEIEALAARQGELETQIAAAAARRHEIEARMRSGAVSDSRDLQAMDGEVRNLAERQARLEEEELELLEAQEPLDPVGSEIFGWDASGRMAMALEVPDAPARSAPGPINMKVPRTIANNTRRIIDFSHRQIRGLPAPCPGELEKMSYEHLTYSNQAIGIIENYTVKISISPGRRCLAD